MTATRRATPTAGCAKRLAQHMLGSLLCPERLTVTNLICTGGGQQQDWSAHYRLYSQDRVDESVLFDEVRTALLKELPAQQPLVVAMDDTVVRKRGVHIHGVGWRRDPLGPPFQTNLVRSQRYLQFSAAWPLAQGAARLLPIGFFHAPSAPKLAKEAREDAQALNLHRERQKQMSLNAHALTHMQQLRTRCEASRSLLFCGDGSYTNAAVLRGLPEGSTYLGRTRKDTALHELPVAKAPGANGRRPSYGPPTLTPEQLRVDEATPWSQVPAFAAGQRHDFRVKTLGPVLWRKAGANLPVRIVVIAPLGYRLRQGSKLLYRQPAYLMCSDVNLPLKDLLQYYLWRWGIEVNFREEKSLIGTGQAQVRGVASNQHLPAMTVAAYAMLWTAALRLHQSQETLQLLKPPRWRSKRAAEPQGQSQQPPLPSTGDLLRLLRYQTWAGAIRPSTLSPFVTENRSMTTAQKPPPSTGPSLPGMLFAVA